MAIAPEDEVTTEELQTSGADDASLGGHVREQLLDRLRLTQRLFADGEVPHDLAVHQARKNMKRVRAILRLKMDAAAIDTADEQRRCRRIGRRLSSLRDADVMLLTLQKVLVDAGERLSSSRVGDLQAELESRRAALLAAGAFDSQVVGALRSDLAAVIRDVEARPVLRLSDTILIDAVRTSKRKGRAAYEKLGRRASDEALHRLRKRAKRELYQRDLLDGRVPLDLARQAGLDVLSAELGWHQDLVVLRAAATEHEALCPDLDVQLRRQKRNSRRRLRRQAARLYG